ncbi:MAG: NAD(P)/FAD-dependent oxidoreductase [candidate division KSB1 bacterium]|nr:NAD(P)/FAD-dependent oxidoreductase [candidate division KSB1 bacterium]
MSERIRFTIIGAGVIGCAIAHRLSARYQDIVIIEKNVKVTSENQSSRNSGVLHAGVYYPREMGVLRSRLCVAGNRELYEFCTAHDVPVKKTGKIIVATSEKELPFLEETYRIAVDNGVPDVRFIPPEEVRQLEPNVSAIRALLVPTSGIVEPTRLVYELHRLAVQNDAFFLFGTELIRIEPGDDFFRVTTISGGREETFETSVLINAAGLYSDRIARLVNPDFPHSIIPLRGESAKFYKSKRPSLNHNGMNVYPVPHAVYPSGKRADIDYEEYVSRLKAGEVLKTVGVHLTPTFDMIDDRYDIGNVVTIGPAYNRSISSRDDYSSELLGEDYYLSRVEDYFPSIELDDISLHQTGIQARLNDTYDWVIERDVKNPNCIQLVGIDSPGLTACLAIAGYVDELISKG